MTSTKISSIVAREILSTGSYPTVEAEVVLDSGVSAVASTPRGTSAGTHEPAFLLDGDKSRFHGKGVLRAVELVGSTIARALHGTEASDQERVDAVLRELDGTENLEHLGVNSVLAVSLACARAASKAEQKPLYEYLLRFFGEESVQSLPRPMVVLIEGGKHADNSTDFQEYLALGLNEDRRTAIRHCAETYQELRSVLKEEGHEVNVGYEGAYAFSRANSNEEPLKLIESAALRCGLSMSRDLGLAMDPASSEFFQAGSYALEAEQRVLSSSEMVSLYSELAERHPALMSLEDGLAEDDWEGWVEMRNRVGNGRLIVGDDLTVTNVERVRRAIDLGVINALLVKPVQAGTLTSTVEAIQAARSGGCEIVVSHRGGGETNDTFIVDLAIASGAAYLKCGISRGERVEKWNYLMGIENTLRAENRP